MATIHDLISEAERISKGSLLLSAASPSQKIVGWWRGRNPDCCQGSSDDRHRISVDCGWLARSGIRIDGVLSVYDVAPRWGWPVPVRLERRTGEMLTPIAGGIPLAASEVRSLPPLEALCLYGGEGVLEWLASIGLDRTDYDDAAATPEGIEYQERYQRQSPLQMTGVAAVMGGWHAIWPEDDFYTPREMRLVLWTLWDSEPWIEVFERFPNYPVRLRTT